MYCKSVILLTNYYCIEVVDSLPSTHSLGEWSMCYLCYLLHWWCFIKKYASFLILSLFLHLSLHLLALHGSITKMSASVGIHDSYKPTSYMILKDHKADISSTSPSSFALMKGYCSKWQLYNFYTLVLNFLGWVSHWRGTPVLLELITLN